MLIQMRPASLNYRDLLVMKGLYAAEMRLPLIPVSDGVGNVVAVGDKVTRVKPGDWVAGIFDPGWLLGEATEAPAGLGGPGMDSVLARSLETIPDSGHRHRQPLGVRAHEQRHRPA